MEKYISDLYEHLCKQIKTYHRDYNQVLIKKAFLFALDAHKDHVRKSGEHYIVHPLSAALHLTRIGADEKTIIGALLHDVFDNHQITSGQIEKIFGKEITKLVIGVYSLGKIYYRVDMTQVEVDILKKNLILAGDDIRIFLIKIAERLHNLQTLQYLPQAKRYRIAKESEAIYLPILNFLSIGEFMSEFNELCFQYIDEKQYKKLQKIFGKNKEKYEKIIIRAYEKITGELEQTKIKYSITSRIKSLHSIYKKIEGRNLDLGNIYDFLALRILCKNIDECYIILGRIHKSFKLKEEKFKDYIAVPKENGYQSIHTTVYDHEGNMLEFQIQTYDMLQLNKTGLAAHFMYKGFGLSFETLPEWMRGVLDIQKQTLDGKAFIERLRKEVLISDIKCFDSNRKTYILPKGSILLDFLFTQKEEDVLYFEKAFVNGKPCYDIYTMIQHGDRIQIQTGDEKYLKYRIEQLSAIRTEAAKKGLIKILKKHAKYLLLEWGKYILNEKLDEYIGKDFSLLPEKIQKSVIQHLGLYDQGQLYFLLATNEIEISEVLEYIKQLEGVFDFTHKLNFKIITKTSDTKIVSHILDMTYQLGGIVDTLKYNNKKCVIYLGIYIGNSENYNELLQEFKRLPNVAEVYRIFPLKVLINCSILVGNLGLILASISLIDQYASTISLKLMGATFLLLLLIFMRGMTKYVFHYFYRLKRGMYFIFGVNFLAFFSVLGAFMYWEIYRFSVIGFSGVVFLMFFLLFYNIFLTYSLYYRK